MIRSTCHNLIDNVSPSFDTITSLLTAHWDTSHPTGCHIHCRIHPSQRREYLRTPTFGSGVPCPSVFHGYHKKRQNS